MTISSLVCGLCGQGVFVPAVDSLAVCTTCGEEVNASDFAPNLGEGERVGFVHSLLFLITD
jgi:hypothetical protein